MIRIILQRDKCIGCNACVEAANARWRMSRKDGKSVLIGATQKKQTYSVIVGDDEQAANMQALRNCPTKVIQIIQL